MGISIAVWRARIGCFMQPKIKGKFLVPGIRLTGVALTLSLRLATCLAVLILQGGDVELNPGPLGPKHPKKTTGEEQTTLLSHVRVPRSTSQERKNTDKQDHHVCQVSDIRATHELNPEARTFISTQSRPSAKSITVNEENVLDVVRDLTNKMEKLKAEMNEVKEENKRLKTKVNKLEEQAKRDNLIFYGVEEENGLETWADCKGKVRSIMRNDMNLEESEGEIEIARAHRLPWRAPGKPRPIIVKYEKYKDKEKVLIAARTELKNKNSQVYVQEDFGERVREARKNLRPMISDAEKEGKKAKLRCDKLIIDNKVYIWDEDNKVVKCVKSRNRPSEVERENSPVIQPDSVE